MVLQRQRRPEDQSPPHSRHYPPITLPLLLCTPTGGQHCAAASIRTCLAYTLPFLPLLPFALLTSRSQIVLPVGQSALIGIRKSRYDVLKVETGLRQAL